MRGHSNSIPAPLISKKTSKAAHHQPRLAPFVGSRREHPNCALVPSKLGVQLFMSSLASSVSPIKFSRGTDLGRGLGLDSFLASESSQDHVLDAHLLKFFFPRREKKGRYPGVPGELAAC